MNFFRKKETIPPVAPPAAPSGPPPASQRYAPQTYVPSRDAGKFDSVAYSASTNKGPQPNPNDNYYDRYSRSRNVGDVYARGGGDATEDRNELFSGYDASKSGGSGRFFDGGVIPDREPGQETEEDIEGIKKQTRFVKQESVHSTRNALQMARQAEETARNTLTRLGDQSEKLANTERHLDVSKGYSMRADDKTDELKQLNRSIFRPVITWNKDAKRAAQEAKIQARYEEERDEREKAMMDIRETQARLGQASTYGRSNEEELLGGSRFKNSAQSREQRKRYQFEATASDDELEDELDTNLDEISDISKRLKALGTAMGQELDNQNARIDRIAGKTDALDSRIHRNTERLKRI
ncbi:protein transporter SEC9 [Coprinopsis cinerea okayama7|uniref:Protein transport protein SEC9 n=1 Tax=Coprinopsis cinerea (strain Okayama-7 / 130 / ATCC MYA-4618 / FGSC 9003) TaxID=240176 RepID=A8N1Q1_COPC7|nr:protein transporter SEC9 [Coprinopsis cinerea okayama7\|eukprot:XP_001828745.1 protein transporter SEC9 [Coprinopsis cinerea okayama7\